MAASPRTSVNATAHGCADDSAAEFPLHDFNIDVFTNVAAQASMAQASRLQEGGKERCGRNGGQAGSLRHRRLLRGEQPEFPHWKINHSTIGYFFSELVFTEILTEAAACESRPGTGFEKAGAAVRASTRNIHVPANKEYRSARPNEGLIASCLNRVHSFMKMLLNQLSRSPRAIGRGGRTEA